MKRFLILLMAALCVHAQEPVFKLMSVTWAIHDHKLRWEIAQGHEDDNGRFVAEKLLEQCEVDPDKGTMTVAGETRKFSQEEAAALHRVLDMIAQYAADSFIWWKEGGGKDPNERVAQLKPLVRTYREKRPK